jgi:hypothetical protein
MQDFDFVAVIKDLGGFGALICWLMYSHRQLIVKIESKLDQLIEVNRNLKCKAREE